MGCTRMRRTLATMSELSESRSAASGVDGAGAMASEGAASRAAATAPAPTSTILEPDLTWLDGRFAPAVQIEVLPDGRLGRVGVRIAAGQPVQRLPGRAVIPGFVNAHSHAFQIGLRGQGEHFPAGAGSFWSWREAMYALVERLNPDEIHRLSLRCFREMLQAGITAVGEFHYVHRSADGRWGELDEAVLRAAAEAGIRIVLLQSAYRTGAIGQPLRGGQVRFDTEGTAHYLAAFERLQRVLNPRTQSAAVVCHSVRAVPWEEIRTLRRESRRRGTVFHMHVEEVIPEIEDCVEHYGRRPMQMVVEDLEVDDRFTAVHCTHTAAEDMERFVEAGGTVCLCPLTEGNLGDGIPDTRRILGLGGRIAFGSDLNSRLCAFEELRWIEYVQRLVRRERGALRDEDGLVAPRLMAMGTVNGATSLGLAAGRIAPGLLADLVAVDLAHPTLEGWTRDSLADALIFGAGNSVIREVWVGGRRIV